MVKLLVAGRVSEGKEKPDMHLAYRWPRIRWKLRITWDFARNPNLPIKCSFT